MKRRQYLALQYRSKIDQHVAAADKVQLGKRGIGRQIVPGKNAHLTDALGDLVTVLRPGEKPRQLLGRDRGQRSRRVYSRASFFDCCFADIGGENLERN